MRKTVEDRKNEYIAALTTARQELLAAADAVPPEAYDTPCIGVWSIKDLLAHLIGWDETNRNAVQEILRGERPAFFQYYDKDWQTYNASLVRRHRREPLSALLADLEASHQRLLDDLQSLSARQVLEGKSPPEKGRPVTIRRLLRAEAADERKHAAQVQAFVARLRGE